MNSLLAVLSSAAAAVPEALQQLDRTRCLDYAFCMNSCRLVMVEWVDSRQPTPGWQRLSHYEPATRCDCASVGWLIHDGDDIKALAPNMADIGDGDDMQASGVIHIPTVCITRISTLAEAS